MIGTGSPEMSSSKLLESSSGTMIRGRLGRVHYSSGWKEEAIPRAKEERSGLVFDIARKQ